MSNTVLKKKCERLLGLSNILIPQVRSYLQNPDSTTLEYSKNQLEQLKKDVVETYDQYLSTIEDEDLANHIFEQQLTLEEEILKLSFEVVSQQDLLTSSSNNSVSEASNVLNVKLPQIELPSFDGKPENWDSFWDHFGALIHNRTDLADVVKLNYLRGSLTGNALTLIEGLSTTDRNYKAAVELLSDTYENKDKTVRAMSWKLLHLKKPGYSHTELIAFRAQLESYLRILVSL